MSAATINVGLMSENRFSTRNATAHAYAWRCLPEFGRHRGVVHSICEWRDAGNWRAERARELYQ
jgi:hypothetical protein